MLLTAPESGATLIRHARASGLRRWLPGLELLRRYNRNLLVQDLAAGVALTAFLAPVGIGYAEAAGLPAIYGLYASIIPLLAYALFGPSRILILGPDSAVTVLVGATIIPLAAGDSGRAAVLAALLAIISGALCILAGLARFGFITDLLSKPIRHGYMNGIALTLMISQLPKLLGFSVQEGSFLDSSSEMARGILDGRVNGFPARWAFPAWR